MSDTGWPTLGYETHDWFIEPSLPMSNTARRRHDQPYEASITPDIADINPTIGSEVLAAAEEASIAIVRFDAEHGNRIVPFSSTVALGIRRFQSYRTAHRDRAGDRARRAW